MHALVSAHAHVRVREKESGRKGELGEIDETRRREREKEREGGRERGEMRE